MNVFMNKPFDRWARKEGIGGEALRKAIDEMEHGLIDANLGGNVYKKRIAAPGRGKSGSYRTILVYRQGDKVFFVHGFAKNDKGNIDAKELRTLKKYAALLLGYGGGELEKAVKGGELKKVER